MGAKKIFPLLSMIHRNWKDLTFYMQGTASRSIWRHFNICGVVQEICPTVDIATDLCVATVPPKISIVPTIKNSIWWKCDSKCVLWKKGRKLWLGTNTKNKFIQGNIQEISLHIQTWLLTMNANTLYINYLYYYIKPFLRTNSTIFISVLLFFFSGNIHSNQRKSGVMK
jgi:hypothetical protein